MTQHSVGLPSRASNFFKSLEVSIRLEITNTGTAYQGKLLPHNCIRKICREKNTEEGTIIFTNSSAEAVARRKNVIVSTTVGWAQKEREKENSNKKNRHKLIFRQEHNGSQNMDYGYLLAIHWTAATQKDRKLICSGGFVWFGGWGGRWLFFFTFTRLSSLRGVKPIANTVMFCPHSK